MKKRSGAGFKFIYPVILIAGIALSVVILMRGQRQVDRTRQEIENLKVEKKEKEAANLELRETIDRMDTPEYIEKVARDELNMARPGETIYEFKNREEAGE